MVALARRRFDEALMMHHLMKDRVRKAIIARARAADGVTNIEVKRSRSEFAKGPRKMQFNLS